MIVSIIKGRIRIVDERLKDEGVRNDITKMISEKKGIKNFRITELVGSLLIEFDEKTIAAKDLVESLKAYVNCEIENQNNAGKGNHIMHGIVGGIGKFGGSAIQKGLGQGGGCGGDTKSGISGSLVSSLTAGGVVPNLLKSAVLGGVGYGTYKKGCGMMGKGNR